MCIITVHMVCARMANGESPVTHAKDNERGHGLNVKRLGDVGLLLGLDLNKSQYI